MAKTLLVQLLNEVGDLPIAEADVRHHLEQIGLVGPEHRVRIIEVHQRLEGPPSADQIQEWRRRLELADDDELEVAMLTVSPVRPPTVLLTLLMALLNAGEGNCSACDRFDCPSHPIHEAPPDNGGV